MVLTKGMEWAKLDKVINDLKSMEFVLGVYLFGSQVNGKSNEDSDLDIAVITKKISRNDELDIISLGDDKLDISLFHRLPLIIQFRVLRDGKLIYCRDKKEIVSKKVEVFRRYLDFSDYIKGFYRRVITNV